MAFKFKMQKILDYRAQLEEEAKVKLADAQAKLKQCQERLEALLGQLAEAETKRSAAIDPAEYWLHDQYVKGVHADQKELSLQHNMLAQMVEEARRYLSECAINRKVLEKLKEHHKIQYFKAEQKQELNFNDEIATIRHKAQAL